MMAKFAISFIVLQKHTLLAHEREERYIWTLKGAKQGGTKQERLGQS